MNALFKICGKCKEVKSISDFTKDRTKSDGFCNYCRVCSNIRNKKYAENNTTKVKVAKKKYRDKNKKQIREYRIKNREKLNKYLRKYNDEHKEERSTYNRLNKGRANKLRNIRHKNNINIKINSNMSSSMRQGLKTGKGGKSWIDCVDYDLNDLIKRLKSTLPKGYIWSDYVNGADLHIDHIIPKSIFNITSINCTDFKRCWALKNLQLLPAQENMIKSDKIEMSFQPSLRGF